MNYPLIFLVVGLYVFWLSMMVLVHRKFGELRSSRMPMTLTFYTLGLAAPLFLLSKKEVNIPTPAWLKTLRRKLSFLIKRRGSGGDKEDLRISFIGQDGETSEPARGQGKALKIAGSVLQDAIQEGATDVHFEPEPDQLKVRYRIDGMLQFRHSYPPDLAPGVVSSLKVLAGEDMAERRRAQDGSFGAVLDGRDIDFRTATTGTSHGEKMVVRILDKKAQLRSMENLGMRKRTLRKLQSMVERPTGMLVVCGPTGSGKSTTLYAALQEVDTIARNVITIEDPIEYHLENISQLNINERAGITFAKLLRNTLRQDPDILMVGEIRDKETAEIAMQAALTGHFVYTTAHANDTVSSIFRLLDLSVKPYLIASSVSAILAQRLVRTLCPTCKVAREPTEEELENLGIDRSKVDKLYDPEGCDECFGTGYRGRTGVFELLEFNDELQDLVQSEPSIPQVKKAAKRAGLVPLRQDALVKALQGVTSLQEAIRVTR